MRCELSWTELIALSSLMVRKSFSVYCFLVIPELCPLIVDSLFDTTVWTWILFRFPVMMDLRQAALE